MCNRRCLVGCVSHPARAEGVACCVAGVRPRCWQGLGRLNDLSLVVSCTCELSAACYDGMRAAFERCHSRMEGGRHSLPVHTLKGSDSSCAGCGVLSGLAGYRTHRRRAGDGCKWFWCGWVCSARVSPQGRERGCRGKVWRDPVCRMLAGKRAEVAQCADNVVRHASCVCCFRQLLCGMHVLPAP
jgi:hypothetical protein